MTLHPVLLNELVHDEIAVARHRLGDRISDLYLDGTDVICRLEDTSVGTALLRFAARDYDAEPLRFAVITATGDTAPVAAWPGATCSGVHPVLERPFACIQGTFEYHTHPSHISDGWDAYRATLRLPHLIDHLVRKAGR